MLLYCRVPIGPENPRHGAKGLTTLSEKRLHLGQKLTVISADIVEVAADAIVNPTDAGFFLGGEIGSKLSATGGAAFIKNVADLQAKHGSLAVADAAICEGVNFAAKHVIHCNGPTWGGHGGNAAASLEVTVKNCLKLAENEHLTSICFPSIGSGRGGIPKQLAAETILRAIRAYFVAQMTSTIKQVYFCLYDQESINVYISELGKLDK